MIAAGLVSAVFFQVASGSASTLVYHSWDPVVAVADDGSSYTLTAVTMGEPTLVQLVTAAGPVLPLTLVDVDTYQVTMSSAEVLDGYVEGDAHNWVGNLEVYGGTILTAGVSVRVNVRDSTMPPVVVSSIAEDAQSSRFLVNLRRDALWLSGSAPQDVLQRFYELFPDDFDFIAVVSQARTTRNRSFQRVRNATMGIGLALFDNGALYGSESSLLGIINYPIDTLFDLATKASSHEIGHQWMSHWPISDVAYGMMGFNLPGGVGGDFPFRLTRHGSGDYRVHLRERATTFNDQELYLMGLIPAADFPDYIVFQNQNQRDQLNDGGILQGPVDVISIGDVISKNGPRVPGVGDAQTRFALATIVLSAGRLLNGDEMAFFDYMASRGEATSELWYTEGGTSGFTKPFYLATSGLATLSTRIALAEPSATPVIAVGACVLGALSRINRRA